MATGQLHTYLGDHLTGSSVVVEVATRRLRRTGEQWLQGFLDELDAERRMLQDVADAVGTGSPVGRGLGRVAAAAGQVKLRFDGWRDPSLRDLLELELFRTGVEGKLCLWRAARVIEDPHLGRLDLDRLEVAGERQASTIEEHRLAAAARLALS